jgi:hypothetical protein
VTPQGTLLVRPEPMSRCSVCFEKTPRHAIIKGQRVPLCGKCAAKP